MKQPRFAGRPARPTERVGVKPLLALAFGLIFAGCSPGWQCLNRAIPLGRWTVSCRFVNGDRSCSAVETGAEYALVMINHERLHAREYALFVTDRRATADSGGNALFQVLPPASDPAHPGLPTLSDYVVAGASKNGVLTVVLRKDDVDALSGADGFLLAYTRNGAPSPALTITTHGEADVYGSVLDTMNGCLDTSY